MAYTPYTLASAALVSIGANPVTSFSANGTAEQVACYYQWQPCLDNWFSIYPWRFATIETSPSMLTYANPNPKGKPLPWPQTPPFVTAFALPQGYKAIQGMRDMNSGEPIEFDHFVDRLAIKGSKGYEPILTYTIQVPIALWPGYFVSLIEADMAVRLSFALSAKLDLRKDFESAVEIKYRIAKNADSRQQTARKFKLTGRRSIMEARRG